MILPKRGDDLTRTISLESLRNMIGTTRETVNRMLNRFWDEHLIDMRTSHVVIVDPVKLGAIVP